MNAYRLMPTWAALSLAALSAGCDGGGAFSSSLQLSLDGELRAGSATHVVDTPAGGWRLVAGDDDCPTCERAVNNSFGTDWLSPRFEATTAAGVQLSAQFDLGNGPGVGHAVTLELSANTGDLSTSSGTVPFELGAGAVVVDRLWFTEDPVEPLRIDVLIDGEAQQPALALQGEASLFVNCGRELPGGLVTHPVCAGVAAFTLNAELAGTQQVLPCPAEVSGVFAAAGEFIVATEASHSVRVGEREPLSCVKTPAYGWACGATRENVSADGCTWRVDAVLLSPRRLAVSGKASGCERETPYCHELFFSP